MTVTITDIKQAAATLKGQIVETPFRRSARLSQVCQASVWLKSENQQLTGSFKDRGALVKLTALSQTERERGIIAMSAGNHAQAVAYQAQRLGIQALVIMPDHTPTVKVDQVLRYGAEVRFHGETLAESISLGQQLAQAQNLTVIHPYDDEQVIAGQGTVGLEMLLAQPDLDTLLVPVGGGGLISGVAIAAKYFSPNLQVIGVQTERFPAMQQALLGKPIVCGHSTIADGIAVKGPGTLTLPLVRQWVDDIWLVDEAEIEEAVRQVLEWDKTLVEGAGAVGVAALLRHREALQGQKIGVILSGGNIDLLVLNAILKRSLFRSGRLVHLYIEVRDVPGALARVTHCIAEAGANVIEVHHHREFTHLSVQSVEIEIVMLTRGQKHVQEIIADLEAQECRVRSHPVACLTG